MKLRQIMTLYRSNGRHLQVIVRAMKQFFFFLSQYFVLCDKFNQVETNIISSFDICPQCNCQELI